MLQQLKELVFGIAKNISKSINSLTLIVPDEVGVTLIAKQYGGGGHKGAAGFVVDNIENFLSTHKY